MYYKGLNEKFSAALIECQNYIQNHDIHLLEKGQHLIRGTDFYVNILEYTTQSEKHCIWEAHKKYLDVHYIIEGEEYINVSNTFDMKEFEYNEDADYLKIDGICQNQLLLKSGILLLLDTNDAHKTGIQKNGSCFVKKAVFKIKIEQNEDN